MDVKKAMSNQFSEQWWAGYPEVLRDLQKKLADPSCRVDTPPYVINRPYLACKYVYSNLDKGGNVLDMACGIGFVSHCLLESGYHASAFDFSDKGIERAKATAESLGQDPDLFVVSDESYLSTVPEDKFDAVLALGYLRYVDPEAQNQIYRDVFRILKPGGYLIIDHQNSLYEAFALNDGSLKFWAEFIEGFSGASAILGEGVLESLEREISVPSRKYSQASISRHMQTYSENPLTYEDKAESYGFSMLDMVYPHADLIPPFLQQKVNKDVYHRLCDEVCLSGIRDWRAMFMSYQFLTLLKKN